MEILILIEKDPTEHLVVSEDTEDIMGEALDTEILVLMATKRHSVRKEM